MKFRVHDLRAVETHLQSIREVELHTSVNHYTGLISDYPKRGVHQNIEISINEKSLYVQGSLHKMTNLIAGLNDQNYNDFPFDCVNESCDYIADLLGINLADTTVTTLEFGANIETSIDPQYLVKYNLLMHDYQGHNKDLPFKGRGDYKEFQKTDYIIKVYNKGKQYKQEANILRVELKIVRKRFLEKLGIFSLADITKPHVVEALYTMLLQELEKLNIIDDFTEAEMTSDDRNYMTYYTNPNIWNIIARDASYKVRDRKRREFQQLIQKYHLDALKREILTKVTRKYHEMMDNPCKALKIAA